MKFLQISEKGAFQIDYDLLQCEHQEAPRMEKLNHKMSKAGHEREAEETVHGSFGQISWDTAGQEEDNREHCGWKAEEHFRWAHEKNGRMCYGLGDTHSSEMLNHTNNI